MSSISASAQNTDQPIEIKRIYECKTIASDTARLGCYDSTVSALSQRQQAGQIAVISREQAEAIERDSFGFSIPSLPKISTLFGNTPNSSSAQVGQDPKSSQSPDDNSQILVLKKTERIYRGKTRFYFENGQVWTQTDETVVRVPKDKEQVTCLIERGVLNNYMLQVNGKGPRIRVKRTE